MGYVRLAQPADSFFVWATVHPTVPDVLMLMDTGAGISMLPQTIYDAIPDVDKQPLEPTSLKILAGNNTDIVCKGTAEVRFSFSNMTFVQRFYISAGDTLGILGTDFMTKETWC